MNSARGELCGSAESDIFGAPGPPQPRTVPQQPRRSLPVPPGQWPAEGSVGVLGAPPAIQILLPPALSCIPKAALEGGIRPLCCS